MVVERIVDARDMESPRPLETVLAAVRELRDGEYVAMLHRREPVPLYPMLAELGLSHRTIAGGIAGGIAGDDGFRILIWRRTDAAAAAHCGPADAVPPDAPEPCR